ncbi:tail fiber assembly protein [Pseudomonas lini]|uniref:tail fiber assembly protein n=1 Tax=Pseudomonas lini TaxID=163011 RepID=UPI00345E3238
MVNYLIDDVQALIGPVVFPVIPGLGALQPSNSIAFVDVLETPAVGFIWALVEGEVTQVPDRRGTVYRVDTGASEQWVALGELPAGLTEQVWPGAFHVWGDGAWQFDESAKRDSEAAMVLADRDSYLRDAVLRIAPLQYAVDLGDATQQEQSTLQGWKRYCVALSRIEQQVGFPFEVEWPILAIAEPKEPTKSLLSLFRTK